MWLNMRGGGPSFGCPAAICGEIAEIFTSSEFASAMTKLPPLEAPNANIGSSRPLKTWLIAVSTLPISSEGVQHFEFDQ
eukprot:UN04951